MVRKYCGHGSKNPLLIVGGRQNANSGLLCYSQTFSISGIIRTLRYCASFCFCFLETKVIICMATRAHLSGKCSRFYNSKQTTDAGVFLVFFIHLRLLMHLVTYEQHLFFFIFSNGIKMYFCTNSDS